jgi:L,D-peptidoglycan transpeptidase YkuD (ErfK/YbiS/YcfS/YnhG family)
MLGSAAMRTFRWLFLVIALSRAVADELAPPAEAQQLVVVSTPDWSAVSGTLRRWERRAAGESWHPVGAPVRVTVGRAGLAWGLGLHTAPTNGPHKAEGDGKGPAGVFRLTAAFGYDAAPAAVKLPYVHARAGIEAVDDPRSRYYNQIVDRAQVAKVDWKSSEKMRRSDDLYRCGIVVAHNPKAEPGAGSCIFLHVWRSPADGTAGCTAMPLADITELQRWLDPAAQPALLQAPREFIPAIFR